MPAERQTLEVQQGEDDGDDFPRIEGTQKTDESAHLRPAHSERQAGNGSHNQLLMKEIRCGLRFCRWELCSREKSVKPT